MSFYHSFIYKNVENFLCICNAIIIINTIKNKFLASPNYIKISLCNYSSILFKFKTFGNQQFKIKKECLLLIQTSLNLYFLKNHFSFENT